MANRTVKEAKNIHGTNPQYLIEKIIRSRIYDCKYWKEQCFALTAELLVDKAMELRYIGGVYGGNIKPTQFLCLILKMLQIQPEKDIVVEFIKNEEFKYVRALGAFYLRLTGTAVDCYKYLEPLYIDNRKLRRQNRAGKFEIVYMDEFIDELLRSDRVCDIILPRIQKRSILEENNELEPKVCPLDEDLDEELPSDDEGGGGTVINVEEKTKLSSTNKKKPSKKSVSRSRSRSREVDINDRVSRDYAGELEEYHKQRERYNRDHGYTERDRERERDHSKREKGYGERDRDRDRQREREKETDRDREREKRKERERDRERERERERERDRGRERSDRDRDRYYDSRDSRSDRDRRRY